MLFLSTQAVQRLSDRLVFAMIEVHVEENRRVEATWGPWATVGLSMVAGFGSATHRDLCRDSGIHLVSCDGLSSRSAGLREGFRKL